MNPTLESGITSSTSTAEPDLVGQGHSVGDASFDESREGGGATGDWLGSVGYMPRSTVLLSVALAMIAGLSLIVAVAVRGHRLTSGYKEIAMDSVDVDVAESTPIAS